MNQPAPRGSSRRILVCDGEQRSALAVVRSLGRGGHRVAVCSHERRCLASASRWASREFEVPSPRLDGAAYLAAVKAAAKVWSADVVFPATDFSNVVLLGHRADLAPALVPGPTLEAFLAVSDKRLLLARANALGIPTPEQVSIDGPGSIEQALSMQGPFAVKSATTLKGAYHRVLYARDTTELRSQLLTAPAESFPLLVQRRIIGTGVGVFLLIDRGQPVATFAHERIREQPPSGGAAVYSRSATVPPRVIADAIRLLNAHGWSGAAMIEFKRERTTGTHYLMEVNGRLWGSLQLAIDAGVDFPAMISAITLGQHPPPVHTYAVGVHLRSFWRDVDHLLARIRHSPTALDLPPGARGRIGALVDFLSFSPREHLELLRFSDPGPFVHATIRYAKARLGFA